MKLICSVITVIIFLTSNAIASDALSNASVETEGKHRVVILAPAAADLFKRLEIESMVVGVTNNVDGFPNASFVGTHINPSLERIAMLKPTLIVAGARANPDWAQRFNADLFTYDPTTLAEIIEQFESLAKLLGREKLSHVKTQRYKELLKIEPKSKLPTIFYETRSTPLSLAKNKSIVRDLLEKAGFNFTYRGEGSATSVEFILMNQPDFYIYQVGPMNKNPIPPLERVGWQNFKSCVWKVNEIDFARAELSLFDRLQELRDILQQSDPCAYGKNILMGN